MMDPAIDDSRKAKFQGALDLLLEEREQKHQEVVKIQKALRELDGAIITLRQRIDPTLLPHVMPQPPANPRYREDQRYADISVHWAILHLLSEANRPMTTGEIADGLQARGVRTRAANFANNVSAMLSSTMRERGDEEVETIDGGWRLTERGRNKIAHIMTTPRFLQRCPWAALGAA